MDAVVPKDVEEARIQQLAHALKDAIEIAVDNLEARGLPRLRAVEILQTASLKLTQMMIGDTYEK